jgi:thymidylate synthase
LDWYDSQDLSVANIGKLAKIWLDISDNDGKINSNYGYLIYSKENNEQYKHCLEELLKNPESRRATMIYTRPSIWDEYNKNGMSDFICTNSVQCFIRDNRLIYIVNMRSNDAIFGFFNDFYWHCIVYNRLWADLQASQLVNLNINGSQIIWNANSFHVYERHFPMLQEMIEQYGRFCV